MRPRAMLTGAIIAQGVCSLHDIGTGNGIVQNGGPQTRNKLRTVPLWVCAPGAGSCRTRRAQASPTRSRGTEVRAAGARANFNPLSGADRNRVLLFLSSL